MGALIRDLGSPVAEGFTFTSAPDSDIVSAFREAMKQFTSTVTWPNDVIEDALCEGDVETGGSGWGSLDFTDCKNFKWRGMSLYAAHWLVTSYPSGASDESNVSGGANNAVSAKSVGDESITFASVANLNTGDNWLSSTRYGQQWIRLRKRAGMGARTSGRNARVLHRGSFVSSGLC